MEREQSILEELSSARSEDAGKMMAVPPILFGDQIHLKQVLVNTLKCALQFSANGEIRV